MCENELEKSMLKLEYMIGFEGSISCGLISHPDGCHLLYSVGCTITIEDTNKKTQEFLSGHSNNVTCLALSKSGKFIASGQLTHAGFKAETIIWSFGDRREYCKLSLHRNAVQAVAFSANDKYLVSLGGPDDGSLVVWNIAKKEAICGSPAQSISAGLTHVLTFSNTQDNVFITAGSETLRVWSLDEKTFKLAPVNVSVGQNKRFVKCLQVSHDDSYFVCGTTTGDVMMINMATKNFQLLSNEKERFQLGVTSLFLMKDGHVIVGSGNGDVLLLKSFEEKFKRTKNVKKIQGGVTSISLNKNQFYVGTADSSIFKFNLSTFEFELMKTSHYTSINNLCFPYGSWKLLITSSMQDIRLWNTKNGQELMRISLPNKICNVVAVMRDGKSIISGWDDGCIRAYYPESGKLMYTMDHAYGGTVTSLAVFKSGSHIISGSNLGHVVLWEHTLLKEHKAAVTCIQMKDDDSECITSSLDGSCIFWNLSRRQMIRVNTLFKYLCYHPLEHQILTVGTDRNISYWETFDGSLIRLLEGSNTGAINCVDVSHDGKYFVTGGDDRMLKIWLYDEGEMTHIGVGHSAAITALKISPDQKNIFSTSCDGAILKWTFPYK
ncbi:hypothetical protein HELRODRAFT_187659 [Helobdella robusta]|uniref:Cilia- and flagella-associated protein 52 n=1 Tax=Helobdella robusta TaxID=6412 RepID=T1FPB6_HELRO|nr:hypothetical protein HELRODRAFT_187659 [Helobdella robusta]ESN89994.1 hypothetical protein HELRODRAFT_187659 [Helobdella robusta]